MIKINLSYQGEEAVHYYKSEIKNSSEKWIRDIYSFLVDWHNEKIEIQLKTSGSTGTPKTLLVKKSAMIFSASQTNEFFQLKQSDKLLLSIPAEFIGGKMMLVRAMLCGADIYAVEPKIKFEIPEFKIDFAAMIPLQADYYITNNKNSINKVIIGGASISKSLEEQIRLFNGTQFWSTYGMTETVSHIALRKLNGEDENQFYVPLKNILIGSDERGCLTIYNKNYCENVIVTNDLVKFDSANCFKIIGRIDNVINSGGLKIIPEPIEEEIYNLTNKRNILVGLKDDQLGQRLILILEGNKIDAISLDLLESTLKEKYGNKSPKEIYFINEFVETENGKLNREAIKNLL